ncbi:PepSY domain-containing protein [Streptomyces sp. NPDC015131]|uniref:PepSY domain-containing protein n=1 Tax=Streptomyces sp. NPDC015131 TaxID=3364941 RepID=UPI00370051EF
MTAPSRPRTLAAAAALCAALAAAPLLTACGDQGETRPAAAPPSPAGSPTGSPSPGGRTQDQAERQALLQATKVPWDKAAGTAVAAVPQGRLADIELKWARATTGSPSPSPGPRTPEWEATVGAQDGTAHSVRVDAVTGKVTESRTDPGQDAEDKQEMAGLLKGATVTPQQAVKTATDRTKGTVTAVQLDDTAWSVDIVTGDWNKTTYDIDAKSGSIVREHVDRD